MVARVSPLTQNLPLADCEEYRHLIVSPIPTTGIVIVACTIASTGVTSTSRVVSCSVPVLVGLVVVIALSLALALTLTVIVHIVIRVVVTIRGRRRGEGVEIGPHRAVASSAVVLRGVLVQPAGIASAHRSEITTARAVAPTAAARNPSCSVRISCAATGIRAVPTTATATVSSSRHVATGSSRQTVGNRRGHLGGGVAESYLGLLG